MLSHLKRLAISIMGRRGAYRIGRALYLHARGDIPNNMHCNGEMLIQSGVLAAVKAQGEDKQILVIFDVGANIGEWSTELIYQVRQHGLAQRALLYSFEPVPATAATLRLKLPPNLPWLHVEELALSSTNGSAQIFISSANAGTNSLHPDARESARESAIIQLASAVDFCDSRGIGHVHLLKCDTEGHDMEVIRGALPLLKAGRISVLQFEYNHRWILARNFLRDVFVAIEALPYRLGKLQADQVIYFENWHPELDKFFEGNYVLVHRDALQWFASKSADFDRFNTFSLA
jgi:FkbM family methyltransferase